MKFSEVLQRYHISPLSYIDGMALAERDYFELFKIYSKYIEMKRRFGKPIKYEIEKSVLNKVDYLTKNSIIELEEGDVMDVLMELNDKCVLNGNENKLKEE